MTESRATRSATAYEASLASAVVASTDVNHPNATPPLGERSFDVNVHPRINLIPHPPRARTIQVPQLGVSSPLPVEQPEMSHEFGILEANLSTE